MLDRPIIDSDTIGDDESSLLIEVMEGDALADSVGIAEIVSVDISDWNGTIDISGVGLVAIVGDCELLSIGNIIEED